MYTPKHQQQSLRASYLFIKMSTLVSQILFHVALMETQAFFVDMCLSLNIC